MSMSKFMSPTQGLQASAGHCLGVRFGGEQGLLFWLPRAGSEPPMTDPFALCWTGGTKSAKSAPATRDESR